MNPISKKTDYFKSFDGTRIYYEIHGQGEPLVFAYGIGCLINHWRHQIKYFSQRFQTIVLDYRAHHKSEMPANHENLKIDALARDLHSLMDHLQISQAGFLGHSFGTQVLLRAYDIGPQYFHNLIFVNGFASNPIAGMFGNEIAEKIFRSMKYGFDLAPETLSYIWQKSVNNPLAIQLTALLGGFNINLTHLKDIEIYLKGIAAMDLEAFLAMFQSMMDYDGSPVFDRITVPTLIIGGKKDSVTPQKHQEEMNLKIRKSQLLLVPYGSHCTQLDMPDFVNLRIDKFLTSIKYGEAAAN
ncbi:MAG: alpha/beta hydrolase [Bdellovibrionales bacterium RBG_16_40_8]|nr:MAG: alpha/beta hydrolase [Bdellovibrionales bacterium RBG_16_40_8]